MINVAGIVKIVKFSHTSIFSLPPFLSAPLHLISYAPLLGHYISLSSFSPHLIGICTNFPPPSYPASILSFLHYSFLIFFPATSYSVPSFHHSYLPALPYPSSFNFPTCYHLFHNNFFLCFSFHISSYVFLYLSLFPLPFASPSRSCLTLLYILRCTFVPLKPLILAYCTDVCHPCRARS